jgi:DNA helicase-2/ATP-dependent DNA helicase PcrA
MTFDFNPRPAQKQVLSYRFGTMGVSAVPGSGKTWTLSLLAAELINRGDLSAGQEVLVVTLVNSAVENFTNRISTFLNEMGRIPLLGYRVRTLHGLAHDIVKERPELAGLENGFQIIDEREADRIKDNAVYDWLRKNENSFEIYLNKDLDSKKKENLSKKQIPDLLIQTANQFIKSAKNLQQSPDLLNSLIDEHNLVLPLARFCIDIYEIYQRNLAYQGAVDFDDLINHAYKILTLDESLLKRLQDRWPYILEDEAQDSSLMQTKILTSLSLQKDHQNWVRVGDPNQAIYETFTTADPDLFLDFIESSDFNYTLPNSGRSTEKIIGLANFLVDWTNKKHPNPSISTALYPNKISPVPENDNQVNPISKPDQIHIFGKVLTPDEELQLVSNSTKKWLDDNPDRTAAILAPRNDRGKKLAAFLRNFHGIEPIELLNTTLATRKTTGALLIALSYLINPTSPKQLSSLFQVYKRDLQTDKSAWEEVKAISTLLGTNPHPELFFAPGPAQDWLESILSKTKSQRAELEQFRSIIQKWQQATPMPIDQLILTIANDIFHSQEELTLAHQIASFQKYLADQHPDWDHSTLLDELKSVARNERRFSSNIPDTQFKPEEHKGKVVITTAHKAKGLEWDRVYLISANDYNFPSALPDDYYISEKWFIRDQLNIPAEARAQLNSILDPINNPYIPGNATIESREDYARERLRLLYVSITRAKQELIITWNNGRSGRSSAAVPITALIEYIEGQS